MACNGPDRLIAPLRKLFGVNILRIPKSGFHPLLVIVEGNKKEKFREMGHLNSALKEDILTSGLEFPEAVLSDFSGKKTNTVEFSTGVTIGENILNSFGSSVSLNVLFDKKTDISFSFTAPRERKIDTLLLGELLSGKSIDMTNPAVRAFFHNKTEFYIVDRVITCSNFTMHFEGGMNFKTDADIKINEALGVNPNLKLSGKTEYHLTFSGNHELTFAFSCVRFFFHEQTGVIERIEPVFKELAGRKDTETFHEGDFFVAAPENKPRVVYSPNRVILPFEENEYTEVKNIFVNMEDMV